MPERPLRPPGRSERPDWSDLSDRSDPSDRSEPPTQAPPERGAGLWLRAAALLLVAAGVSCPRGALHPVKPPPAAARAPNSLGGCGMCHVDVIDDFKGTKHLAAKVACVACHGPSDGHAADENNDVKPDQVFARKDADRLCSRCHKCSRPTPEPPPKPSVCTDCHRAHKFRRAGGEGDRYVLCEAPSRPFRQNVPVPFSSTSSP